MKFIGPRLNEKTALERVPDYERHKCLCDAYNRNFAHAMTAWQRKIAHEEYKRRLADAST